jgi:neutral ceramidase
MNPRLLTLLFLVLTSVFSLCSAGDLRVGAAAVKVTPPMGIPMAGYYNTRLAEGTHDDLMAKAIVFEQDGAKAALVALDLVSLARPTVEEARRLISQQTGVRGDAVMISATHSHTGPLLSLGSTRNSAYGGEMDIAKNYTASLPQKIAESVKLAEANLIVAKLSTAVGREDTLPFNRRFFMKDGTVGWNAGKLNPNIVKPAGPIDPDVPVVFAESLTGKPLATYVNFAMHLDTVGGMQFSSDYPFTLAKILGRVKSPDMLTLFTIGCAGDINHVNTGSKDPQKGHVEAARIGTVLAGEVLKTYTRLAPVKTTAPRVRSEIVKLPLPELAPGDVEKARELATRTGGKNEPTFLEKVWAFKVLDVYGREGKPQEVEVQVIALGDDLAFVSLPGEVFVELGQAIKQASSFKHTIIAELANGSIGYIPTKRAFTEGNYEPISARCAEGSGEMLVEAAGRLLKELKSRETLK